jgi:hypothetical protein
MWHRREGRGRNREFLCSPSKIIVMLCGNPVDSFSFFRDEFTNMANMTLELWFKGEKLEKHWDLSDLQFILRHYI